MGLYFDFVETYAQSLVLLLVAVISGMFLNVGFTGLSLLSIIWSFGFILVWRQKQTTRAYNKGILDSVGRGWEEARPEHFGPLSRNQITGKDEPHYDPLKYYCRCTLSYLISGLCCYLSYFIMQYYYSWEKWTYAEYRIGKVKKFA